MDDVMNLAEIDDDELRELCLAAVFWCAEASWVAGVKNAIWFGIADEAYRRGWTDTRVTFEQNSMN